MEGGQSANGIFRFYFELFDAPLGGTFLGAVELEEVEVTDGLFMVELDFGAGKFNGQARWLQISVQGTNGLTLLRPRQSLFPAPYALFSPVAGGVSNGAITSAMLAAGAVTSNALANNAVTASALATGAVTTPKLADGSVTSAKLAPGTVVTNVLATTNNVAVGTAILDGRLDVYRTTVGTPAITLLGNANQISTYGDDGLEQIRLWGPGYGEIWLNNDRPGNQRAVFLSANASAGGILSLNNSNGQQRATLAGGNSGGLLNLFADDGTTTIGLDGAVGQLSLYRNTDGERSIHLFNFGGGALRLNGDNAQQRALLFGANAGGSMQLHNSSNALSVDVRSQFSSGNNAAWMGLNDNGAERISFAARNGSTGKGGLIGVRSSLGPATILLAGDNGGGSPVLSLHDGTLANNNGVKLYSSPGFSGLELRTAGTLRLNLLADEFSGGLICYNAAGTGSIFMDGSLGKTTTKILQITGGSDLSEQFDVQTRDEPLEPGMVVCIDPEHPGQLKVSAKAYDRTVAGIVSGAGGVSPGMLMGQQGTLADGKHPVALTGRVYCLVDAREEAIQPGDLLTTSTTPGHAMKAMDPAKSQGAIIGKAMTGRQRGKGLVLVLVSLQ
jgi:hypothetical protein